jgi:predicted Fe-S protein YdhL (DUF1289 family)
MARSKTTPCVGKCSHNVGDDICKGCNRTIAEVRDWNTFSVAEKIARMEELKTRSVTNLIATESQPLISWNDI